MRVLKLKTLRRRNHNMAMMMNSKKLHNYSSISDCSGDTQDSKDDSIKSIAATAPLFEREIRTSSSGTSSPYKEACPEASTLLTLIQDDQEEGSFVVPEENKDQEFAQQAKRTPVEPVAPLGVVVNEDEWDAISHISGISTRSESADDIQKDFAPLVASFEVPDNVESVAVTAEKSRTITAMAPTVVSPGPEHKKETIVLNNSSGDDDHSKDHSMDQSKDVSLVQSIIQNFENGTTRVNIVVHDAPSSSKTQHMDRIVRILKRFDDKNGRDESSTGSKISHVFEDDQESAVIAAEISTDSQTAPIYSPAILTPAMVSPEKPQTVEKPKAATSFVPSFHAVFNEEQIPYPALNAAVAPSFDGSTATAFTNNTSVKSQAESNCTPNDCNTAKPMTGPVFSSKIHEKMNAIEVTMRSSCQGIGGGTSSPEFLEASPSCDSFLTSTSAMSANLKDSFRQIKRELSGLYESSGVALASVAAKAEEQVGGTIQCPQSFFAKAKTEAAPKQEKTPEFEYEKEEEEHDEHPSDEHDEIMNRSQESEIVHFERTETQYSC